MRTLLAEIYPYLSAIVFLLIMLSPPRVIQQLTVSPLYMACIIFYYNIYHTNIFHLTACLIFGYIQDVLSSTDLGTYMIINLISFITVSAQRKLLAKDSFGAVWIGFALFMLIIGGAYSVIGLIFNRLTSISPIITTVLLTVACYPIIHLFLYNSNHYISSMARGGAIIDDRSIQRSAITLFKSYLKK
jgi:rod shape-determining protein MreD